MNDFFIGIYPADPPAGVHVENNLSLEQALALIQSPHAILPRAKLKAGTLVLAMRDVNEYEFDDDGEITIRTQESKAWTLIHPNKHFTTFVGYLPSLETARLQTQSIDQWDLAPFEGMSWMYAIEQSSAHDLLLLSYVREVKMSLIFEFGIVLCKKMLKFVPDSKRQMLKKLLEDAMTCLSDDAMSSTVEMEFIRLLGMYGDRFSTRDMTHSEKSACISVGRFITGVRIYFEKRTWNPENGSRYDAMRNRQADVVTHLSESVTEASQFIDSASMKKLFFKHVTRFDIIQGNATIV